MAIETMEDKVRRLASAAGFQVWRLSVGDKVYETIKPCVLDQNITVEITNLINLVRAETLREMEVTDECQETSN